MPTRLSISSPEKGISILELLIVVAIAGIIAVFAIAQIGSAKTQFTRQNFAHELKIAFDRARSDSVKRRADTASSMARVVLNSPTSFSLFTDLDQDGTVASDEAHDVNFSDGSTKIANASLAYPVTIRFDRRGFITATDAANATVASSFVVCDGCLSSTITDANSTTVTVANTGTSTIADGASAVTPAGTPVWTNVSSSSQIKASAVVTPSPAPSATPACTVILILCI